MEPILHIQPALDVRIEIVGGNDTEGSSEYNLTVFSPEAEFEPLFEMRLEPLWYISDMHAQLKYGMAPSLLAQIERDRRQFEVGDFHQHTLIRHPVERTYPKGFSFTRALHQTLSDHSAQVPWLRNIISSALPKVQWEGDFTPQGQRTWLKYIDERHPRVAWVQSLNRYRFAVAPEAQVAIGS